MRILVSLLAAVLTFSQGSTAGGTWKVEEGIVPACHMMGPPMRGFVADETPRATTKRAAPPGEAGRLPGTSSGNAERGQRVYLARCTACHNADPARDGRVGPAIQGAPLELVRTRVLWAAYPPGYLPKRNTRIMPAQPDLAPRIADLAAYLGAR